jgi:hypothetical protein
VTDKSRSARLDLRLPPAKLATWRETAQAEKQTLTAFIEAVVDDAVTVRRTIARDRAAEAEQARRWHEVDPSEARRGDWGRSGEEAP